MKKVLVSILLFIVGLCLAGRDLIEQIDTFIRANLSNNITIITYKSNTDFIRATSKCHR